MRPVIFAASIKEGSFASPVFLALSEPPISTKCSFATRRILLSSGRSVLPVEVVLVVLLLSVVVVLVFSVVVVVVGVEVVDSIVMVYIE